MSRSSWRAEARGALSLAGGGLVFLAVAAFADRTFPPLDAFRSLWPHLSVAIAGVGVALLATGAWLRAVGLFAAAAFFIVLIVRTAFWSAMPMAEAPVGAETLRVLTVNALVGNRTPERLAEAIASGGYDLVAIQEGAALEDHYRRLGAVLPYQTGCEAGEACDLVLLSRRPLEDLVWTPFETRSSRLLTASFRWEGVSIGLVSVHLTKPHHDEYQRFQTSRTIRAQHRLPPDAIVVGDFNAAPWTGLLDWFRAATGFVHPAGYRPTAPARAGVLGVPIDQVMVRGRVGVSRIAVLDDALGSNHFGVEADLFLRDR
ncbi:MAG: endonuclease/exonuclease/phosphatase family protein [Pseudomonadota bacterium]